MPLSFNKSNTSEFIERHIDKIDWHWVISNPSLTPELVERHIDKVDWKWVSSNRFMPPEFFEKHIDKLDWTILSQNTAMPPDFFERHIDKVHWEFLSQNTAMPPDFFERHIDKVDWECLTRNHFSEYKDKLIRRCVRIRRLQKSCKLPNRYKLTKLVKTRAFCEWYYRGDNIGGIIAKRRIENTLNKKPADIVYTTMIDITIATNLYKLTITNDYKLFLQT